MSYLVLARKWRPRRFEDMVGQHHVLKALVSALSAQRLHHAYLFTGTRGVGKTTIARIFAKALNCEQGVSATPCGICSACTEVDSGRFVDLIEVDAASRTKVEDTRDLLENVQYAPSRGRYKIYLIDEVHMLSNSSFNALLKTLEEPPPHVKFLLATTDPQKLPVTVLSRCLQFHLKALTSPQIVDRLRYVMQEEKLGFDEPSLLMLARAAEGSLRDALSLLDQAIAHGEGKLNELELRAMLGGVAPTQLNSVVQALLDDDVAVLIAAIADMHQFAPDYAAVLGELAAMLHAAAVLQQVPNASYQDNALALKIAQQLSAADIQLFYQIAIHGRRDLSLAPGPREGFEMCLLRMLAFRPVAGGAANIVPPQAVPRQNSDTRSDDSARQTSGANLAQQQTSVKIVNADLQPLTNAGISNVDVIKTIDLSPALKAVLPQTDMPVLPSVLAPAFNVTMVTANAEPEEKNEISRIWRDWVLAMQLPGLLNNLAQHSALIEKQETHMQLATDSDRYAQWNKTRLDDLQKALSLLLGKAITVALNDQIPVNALTPHQWDVQEKKRKQELARNALNDDPVFRELVEKTGAKILEDSIRTLH